MKHETAAAERLAEKADEKSRPFLDLRSLCPVDSMLFNSQSRDFLGPKPYGESDWNYLNRSGRMPARKVRELLDQWVETYPYPHRRELLSRLVGHDGTNFQSACFELFLFAVLTSLGCSVTPHPELPNQKLTHPDFLAETPLGETVYVEAVLASEFSTEQKAASRRTHVVLDSIQRISSPNFFVSIRTDGHPDKPPNGRRMRKDLTSWLHSLDPDEVCRRVSMHGNDALPQLKWEHGGWAVVFGAIPKKPEKRGEATSPIGIVSEPARWINVRDPIRDAIRTKGKRYGHLSRPLLVAINADVMSVDDTDEVDALFGQTEYVVDFESGVQLKPRRKPNGAWFGRSGPEYTRVAGAWIFSNLDIWNFISRRHTVYWNPWSANPLPDLFATVRHAKAENGEVKWEAGRAVHEILGLSPNWPGDDAE